MTIRLTNAERRRAMKCEILSIGSELTSGQNLDTNSQWLSRRLAEAGIAVGWHTTIADDFDANLDAFRIATGRAQLVLVTGGLGPTQDDLTREVLAKLAGVELVFHEESFKTIQEMFSKRGRQMPERNRVQALFPAGAEVIPNDRGTAPGIWMNLRGAIVAAMPGVPSEMYAMFDTQILPRLTSLGLTGGVLIERKINTFGTGESHVEQQLFDLTRRDHLPEVGITASDAMISLRIMARGQTREEALAQIAPVEKIIRERLGELVIGVGDEDVPHALLKLLEAKRLTLSSAESVTGGTVGQLLTAVPGSSAWYRGGVIAYENRVKMELLGVPQELIDSKGVVSPEVAEAMAVGCRARLKTDLAVSTTGVAGPQAESPDRPAGYVVVGLAWEGGSSSLQFSWLGTRQEVQRRTARLALNRARLHLLRAV
jgi:nicotinamide-nucleotide amidase